MQKLMGHCLCQHIRYECDGDVNWVEHCHCESCRRATSSPITTFFAVPRAQYRYLEHTPSCYESSPGVRRWFCPRCGSPIAFDADRYTDEVHFYTNTLSDPELLQPQAHSHYNERLSYLHIQDDLLKRTGDDDA